MKATIIFFITFLTFNALSQDIQNEVPKKSNGIKVTSFCLSMKPMIIRNYTTDFYDLQKRMLPIEIPSEFPTKDYKLLISDARLFNYNIELGLTSKPNRELLIGISYISGYRNLFDLTKKTVQRYDTIVVQGNTFYADSLTYSNYDYSEYIDELGLVLAYIFKTDQNKKLSLFAGCGINGSYSFSSYLAVGSTLDTITRLSVDKNPYDYLNNYQPDPFVYHHGGGGVGKNDPNLFIRAFIPFGFNWNISKKDDFWKHINVMFLGQIGLEYRHITNEISYFRPYWGIAGWGLKYTF